MCHRDNTGFDSLWSDLMRRWILRLHLYGMLLCSSYLIILGLSTLNFNHGFGGHHARHGEQAPAVSSAEPVTWRQEIGRPRGQNKKSQAEQIRDELGLFGWVLEWTITREDNRDLRLEVARPGRHYAIYYDRAGGQAEVKETRQGVWTIIEAMHGFMGELPNTRLLAVWGWYTEITVWVVLFAAISGVYLWLTPKLPRRVGWMSLFGGVGASLCLMLYVWLRG